MFRRQPDRVTSWMVGAGAAASATAVAFTLLRALRHRRAAARFADELDALEDAAVDKLRRDAITGHCAIDVAAVSPGIVELSGLVPNREAGQRAARMLHSVPGVRTVINRLEEGSVEDRQVPHHARRGEPLTRGRHWYGMRVGTGRRRQSLQTEPERPDDAVKRRTRALNVSASDIAEAAADGIAAHETSRENGG
jgi:hypothetical protein